MDNENAFQFFSDILSNFDEERPTIPMFSKRELISICKESQNIFREEPTQLNLSGDFIIVGDLHGHVFDLFRIFKKYGLPPSQNYIFLGDIVDRGHFSLTIITLILILKVKCPSNIYLLRGNHEFRSVCSNSGFYEEIQKIYKNEEEFNPIFESFIDVFNALPLVAIINNIYICLHGGIGPKFQRMEQLKNIARPMNEIYGGIADEILWSDPSDDVDQFRSSKRGVGYEFGHLAIANFLKENNYRLLIRAHQQIQNGFEYSLDNRVLTVFSASNYCGEFDNFAGVVIVKENSEKEEPVKLDFSQSKVSLEDVVFIESEERTFDNIQAAKRKNSRPKTIHICSQKSTSSLPSFVTSEKRKSHRIKRRSKLHEMISNSSPGLMMQNDANLNMFNDGEDKNSSSLDDKELLAQNDDEIEIDHELGLPDESIQMSQQPQIRTRVSSRKKSFNNLHLDSIWDGNLSPRSFSSRTPDHKMMGQHFSIRSRKGVPLAKKYNFS